MTGYAWRIDDVLRAECDRLLDVLDIGNFTPLNVYGDPNMHDLCWLCNGTAPESEIGLCRYCLAWCRFEHDVEPTVYAWSMTGRYPMRRFGVPNPEHQPWVDPERREPT